MTEKITREQIEEWRQEARYSHHDVMTVKFTPDELLDLCTLALQAEAMREWYETDHGDGLSRSQIGALLGVHPLTALPEPRR